MLEEITYCPDCNEKYLKLKIINSVPYLFEFGFEYDIGDRTLFDSFSLRTVIRYDKDNILFNCNNCSFLVIDLSYKKIIYQSLKSKFKNFPAKKIEIAYDNINVLNYDEEPRIRNEFINFDFYRTSSKYIEDKLCNIFLL